MTLRMVLTTKSERACQTCGGPLKRGYFHQHGNSTRKGRGEGESK